MNKYEKALENIGMIELDKESNGYDDPKYLKDFYYGEYCVLKELVERATPKKPIKDEPSRIRYDQTYVCPSCGQCFSGRLSKFCYHCGQALNWRDEN